MFTERWQWLVIAVARTYMYIYSSYVLYEKIYENNQRHITTRNKMPRFFAIQLLGAP